MNTNNMGMGTGAGASTAGTAAALFKIVFVVLFIVALYYVYKYIFTVPVTKSVTVFGPAKKASADEMTVASNAIPPLVEGGEYTVSFWMYINDWSHRNSMPKHVISIGSPLSSTTGFETLLVYLGPTTNSLHIRTQAEDVATTNTTAPLTVTNVANIFGQLPATSTQTKGCDLETVEMQRWVNVTIAMNGRTTDVYLDGKLARSCVSSGFYRVPATGYQLNAFSYGGFGGFMSNLQLFDSALNPEEVHKIYSTGPHGSQSFLDWLRSIFSPTEIAAGEYPK
jgi:hypothetical protein